LSLRDAENIDDLLEIYQGHEPSKSSDFSLSFKSSSISQAIKDDSQVFGHQERFRYPKVFKESGKDFIENCQNLLKSPWNSISEMEIFHMFLQRG
jgi:hypothetical protein